MDLKIGRYVLDINELPPEKQNKIKEIMKRC